MDPLNRQAGETPAFSHNADGSKNRIKVIASFNGGGVRGIIPARICQEIEEITQRRMVDLVDCFAGTSAGGILATALNYPESEGSTRPKFTAKEVVEFFKKNAEKIFPPSWNPFQKVTALFTSKYSADGLDKVLKENYGEMRLSDSIKDIIIPTSEISHGGSPWWFSKHKIFNSGGEHAPAVSEETCQNILMSEVLKASGAAPYYLPFYSMPLDGREYHFIDGGCYANNPTMIGLSYAHILYGKQTPLIAGYFGTGAPPLSNTVPSSYFYGGAYWCWNYPATSMSLNTEEANLLAKIQMQAAFSWGGAENYFEFQPPISVADFEIDNSSQEHLERLLEATEKYIKDNKYKIKEFCNQLLMAKGFEPLARYTTEDLQEFEGVVKEFHLVENHASTVENDACTSNVPGDSLSV